MIIYLKQNVWHEGLRRIRYLFDEFPNVIVGFSGGKDSVATLELALIVAREKNRLPLKVMFLDQEGEWQGTIDMVKDVMYRKEVDPMWLQIPMVMSNNASSTNRFHKCWNPDTEEKWIHPQDPIAMTENIYGTDRFHELFHPILSKTFPEGNAIYLSGVRAEESPKRIMTLTKGDVYKGLTYGKVFSKARRLFTFYPLYDWSYTDIWHAIETNGWKYNRVYDEMYRHQIPYGDMRISNVHHETALGTLTLIQEIEPETWEKISAAIDGANTIKHLDKNAYKCPKDLPKAFEDWSEYALYLRDNLIHKDKNKELINKKIRKFDALFTDEKIRADFFRALINTILSNDWDMTKFQNWVMLSHVLVYSRLKEGRTDVDRNALKFTKYLTPDMKQQLLDTIESNYENSK